MQELQGAVDTARASLAAKETHTALLQTDVAVLHSELQELRVTLADEVAAARLAALAHKTKGKQKQDRANEEDTQKDETGVSLAVGVCGGYSGTDYSSADRVKASMAFVIESMQGAVLSLPVFLPRLLHTRSLSRARTRTHAHTHQEPLYLWARIFRTGRRVQGSRATQTPQPYAHAMSQVPS